MSEQELTLRFSCQKHSANKFLKLKKKKFKESRKSPAFKFLQKIKMVHSETGIYTRE